MKKGKLFVISGCSGVGKSTVLKLLMAEHEELIFSVSATTRAPRPGEREGVDYTYVSRECFQGMIERDEFLEYDSHMSNFYGTPAKQLEEKMERGIAILDVEPKGAFQVRAKRPDATLIFVAPLPWRSWSGGCAAVAILPRSRSASAWSGLPGKWSRARNTTILLSMTR